VDHLSFSCAGGACFYRQTINHVISFLSFLPSYSGTCAQILKDAHHETHAHLVHAEESCWRNDAEDVAHATLEFSRPISLLKIKAHATGYPASE
jgi:hypothetical protein